MPVTPGKKIIGDEEWGGGRRGVILSVEYYLVDISCLFWVYHDGTGYKIVSAHNKILSLSVTKGLLRRGGKSITEGPHTPDAPPQQAGETNRQTNKRTNRLTD